MKDQRFVVKWVHYMYDYVECSLSCSFSSYEAGSGCRLGLADGHRHPTDKCKEGVYRLEKVNAVRGKYPNLTPSDEFAREKEQ